MEGSHKGKNTQINEESGIRYSVVGGGPSASIGDKKPSSGEPTSVSIMSVCWRIFRSLACCCYTEKQGVFTIKAEYVCRLLLPGVPTHLSCSE